MGINGRQMWSLWSNSRISTRFTCNAYIKKSYLLTHVLNDHRGPDNCLYARPPEKEPRNYLLTAGPKHYVDCFYIQRSGKELKFTRKNKKKQCGHPFFKSSIKYCNFYI